MPAGNRLAQRRTAGGTVPREREERHGKLQSSSATFDVLPSANSFRRPFATLSVANVLYTKRRHVHATVAVCYIASRLLEH